MDSGRHVNCRGCTRSPNVRGKGDRPGGIDLVFSVVIFAWQTVRLDPDDAAIR